MEYQDTFGHEMSKGSFIQFKARGVKPTLYGQIQDIIEGDKPKYKIRVLGWLGKPEQRAEIKKDFYEVDVNSKHVMEISWKSNVEDQLKKDGIII